MARRIFAKSAIAACTASILKPVLDVNGPWEKLTRFRSALVIVAVISASFGDRLQRGRPDRSPGAGLCD